MTDNTSNRIGLLGGSFNPVHVVHINLALAALKQMHLQEVQLLPAAQPWQKGELEATAQDRVNMLKLAIQNHPGLTLNLMEIKRGGPTYTIDTVRTLPKGPDYYWIMGSDQLRNFCTWNYWDEIVELVNLVVAKRPEYDLTLPPELLKKTAELGRQVHFIEFPEQDVSSTQIRDELHNQHSPSGLLSPAVLNYINQHDLYAT